MKPRNAVVVVLIGLGVLVGTVMVLQKKPSDGFSVQPALTAEAQAGAAQAKAKGIPFVLGDFRLGMSIDEAIKIINKKYLLIYGPCVAEKIPGEGSTGFMVKQYKHNKIYHLIEADKDRKITRYNFPDKYLDFLLPEREMAPTRVVEYMKKTYALPDFKDCEFMFSTEGNPEGAWESASPAGYRVVVMTNRAMVVMVE